MHGNNTFIATWNRCTNTTQKPRSQFRGDYCRLFLVPCFLARRTFSTYWSMYLRIRSGLMSPLLLWHIWNRTDKVGNDNRSIYLCVHTYGYFTQKNYCCTRRMIFGHDTNSDIISFGTPIKRVHRWTSLLMYYMNIDITKQVTCNMIKS